MNSNKINLTAIFIFILLLLLLTNKSLDGWSLITFALFYFLLVKFVLDLGSGLSIRNIIAIIAVLQYLVGAFLGYQYDALIFSSYRMVVTREIYFSFALPATVAYIIGLFFPVARHRKEARIEEHYFYRSKGILLIIAGFIAEFLPFLGFLGYLLSGFKYVGAYYLFATPGKIKYYGIALVFGYLFFVEALASGMFHGLILWGSFSIMVYFMLRPASFGKRLATTGLGCLAIFLIQLIKPDYRILQDQNTIQKSRLTLLTEVTEQKVCGEESWFSEKTNAENVVRLNQGWIVAKVMQQIPAYRPFANGESIKESINASLLPRFISPDKAKAGGRLNMQRYAGITLNQNTSMDIGQLGEAYANYGITGGIAFMFILGFFLNLVLVLVSRKSFDIPELIFWLPLLFLQVVKSETSLVTMLNHLVKASLLTWFIFTPLGRNLIDKGMKMVNLFLKR
jgi:hypothetical protein